VYDIVHRAGSQGCSLLSLFVAPSAPLGASHHSRAPPAPPPPPPHPRSCSMPFLRVLLIRHGQSANNVLMGRSVADYVAGRVADAPLTPLGVEQARAAGTWLGGGGWKHAPDHIYCSPMARALATAAHLVAAAEDCASAPSPYRPRVWAHVHEVGPLVRGWRGDGGGGGEGSDGFAPEA
jgi:hypothetical protein